MTPSNAPLEGREATSIGAACGIELPLDRPRPSSRSARFGAHAFSMSTTGAPRPEALLAATVALIGRLSSQPLVVVGTSSGVVAFDLSDDPPFAELIARARRELEEAPRRRAPVASLGDALGVERAVDDHRTYQVQFLCGEDGRGTSVAAAPGLDLSFEFAARDDAVVGTLRYSEDVLRAETAARIAGHLRTLAGAALERPAERVSALPILEAGERRRLIVDWNAPARELPERCVHELVADQAARRPGAIAVTACGRAHTYRELDERANQLARRFIALGAGPDVLVGVSLDRSFELIVALLATLKAGAGYLPLDPAYPRDRIAYILEDATASIVVTHSSIAQSLPRGPRTILVDADAREIALERTDAPVSAASPSNVAYVDYTSGSTGKPKGVVVAHRSVVRLVSEATYARLGADESVLQFAPIAFDASTFEIWGPLANGGRVVCAPPGMLSVEELARTIEAGGVTTAWLTAGLFNELVDEQLERLRGLRQLITGGQALSVRHVRKALAGLPGCRLVNGYGPTECTTFATAWDVASVADGQSSIPIGRPIGNTAAYVVDEALELVPVGVAGELLLGGPGVARGYLGKPALTAEKFIPDPFSGRPGERLYRTGDIVRRLPDGAIDFIGRRDDQVKIRGFRVELGEVEAAVREHPSVRDAVVIARDEDGAKSLVAYVTAKAGDHLEVGDLRAFVASRVPGHMVPAAFVVLDAIPLNANGKADRRALPRPAPATSSAIAPPRTALEETLAAIWADVLRVERVGVHDDFFALGGHSLLAMRMVSRMRRALGVEVPIRSVFERPTVAALAPAVEAALAGGADARPPLSRIHRDGADLEPSFAQERLWFVEQLEPGLATYNIPTLLRLRGALDIAALERSLAELVARHDALRTTFVSRAGRPVQRIASPGAFPIPLEDLSGIAEGAREDEALRNARAEAARPFDLERGPLIRARLFRTSAVDHALVLTVHHIVSDGWSQWVLKHDLCKIYAAFVAGSVPRLPELSIQYADFAAWQRRVLSDSAIGPHLAFWKSRLAGAPPLELRTDRPRPPVATRRGRTHAFKISAPLVEKLRALAQRENATLFMVLLAAFQTLLHRYGDQEKVVVGTPIANRTRVETERLVGFFVNMLALVGDFAGDPSFREFLRRVREACLGAYAHQDLPFERLVAELAPERSLGRNPIFEVVFVLHNTPSESLDLGGLTVDELPIDTQTARFDLSLAMWEMPDGLAGALEYATDLFEAATIDRLVGHFETLLRAIAADPDAPVSRLRILTAAERERLVLEWNDTRRDLPRLCVHELVAEQAARRPDATAVTGAGRSLNYRELDFRANQLAHRLRALGARPETLVAVSLERSPELIIALLAILKAGAAYLPLDPAYPMERLAFVLADARARILVSHSSLEGALPRSGARLLLVDAHADEIAAGPTEAPRSDATPANVAYVDYTSGSTGRPKGVAVTHEAVVRLVKPATYVRLDEREVVLQLAPVAFDASTFEIWGALANGARLASAPPGALSVDELARTLEEEGVTTAWLTAGLFNEIVDARVGALRGLQQLVVGGQALSVRHVERALAELPGCRIVNGYGPTECTTFATTWDVVTGPPGRSSIPIGMPIGNTVAYVVDASLELVPLGVCGELLVGGPGVARGYLGRPDLTAERFIPNPFASAPGERVYRTGDIVRRLPDGAIDFVGRRDDQVKIRGFRIELSEIEAALGDHSAIRENAVLARDDGAPAGKRVIAYVVPAASATISASDVIAFLRKKLPGYMVPAAVVLLERLPLNANGKVDRRALPAPDAPSDAASGAAPRTPIEETLARIWAEVLGLERVGVSTSFFDVGGHSLLATQVVSRIRSAFGVAIPLRTFFERPTIAALAAFIASAGADSRRLEAPIPRLRRGTT